MQGAAMLFQGLQVTLAVIERVLFPAGVIDANEFVGQRPAGLVVFALVPRFVGVIVGAGPRLLFEGAAGIFTLPGLLKIKVINKPATKARKGINPFTGEPAVFKAKPARRVVKVLPLKALKEMVK